MDWLNKAQLYYRNSVSTIRRWFAEVMGYFEKRTTNGIVEGINNKLKLLKRCDLDLETLIILKYGLYSFGIILIFEQR